MQIIFQPMQITLVLWETLFCRDATAAGSRPFHSAEVRNLSAGSFTQTRGRDSSRAARRRPVTSGCPLPTSPPRPIPPQHPSPGQALTAAL